MVSPTALIDTKPVGSVALKATNSMAVTTLSSASLLPPLKLRQNHTNNTDLTDSQQYGRWIGRDDKRMIDDWFKMCSVTA